MAARADYAAALLENEAGRAVLGALTDLLKSDEYLLQVNANERAISFRLATHLRSYLPEWDIDCEYNRDGVEPKRIRHLGLNPHADDDEGQTVFPDIIAHRRGTRDNYLVIELKKSTNTVPRDVDYDKLAGYKAQLGYKFALFIELGVEETFGKISIEWI